ncbi:MAG: hypothetical protein HY042_10500 [Spirochaetia bacterium]|nr:hypothetical protein [Spirochaetia bacterium]
MPIETNVFSEEQLRLEVSDSGDAVIICWQGRSTQRNPNHFIVPVLAESVRRGTEQGKSVIWDFRQLEYMNSSTITPVIKTLETAKKGSARVSVIYNKLKRWQDLSFSALRIFETKDGRIQVRGE